MVYLLMLVVFALGYTLIAFEHNIKIDKAASALLTGSLCWAIFALGLFEIDVNSDNFSKFLTYFQTKDLNYTSEFIAQNIDYVKKKFVIYELSHHLAEIGQILFFLLGAMTIVELVDAHQGFSVITDRIQTNSKVKLMWILCILSFFFSATLDNLTTAIVMSALLTKIIDNKKDIWLFAGMIIISANAGGAWSPIGDVTTIMLWIGGQITAANIITSLIVPSIVCMIAPLIYLTFKLKGNIKRPSDSEALDHLLNPTTQFERKFIFFLGVFGLLFVPIFKTVTQLPPFIGIILSLGVMWLTTELLHRSKNYEAKSELTVIGVLKKVDVATIFFFLGILLAVAALESLGLLFVFATILKETISLDLLMVLFGFASAVIDNVPLVAASLGMFTEFAPDDQLWHFLAYCAGTGGSMLIIGSAAGVVAMGMEKITFGWYLKKILWIALVGYFAGIAVFMLMRNLI